MPSFSLTHSVGGEVRSRQEGRSDLEGQVGPRLEIKLGKEQPQRTPTLP